MRAFFLKYAETYNSTSMHARVVHTFLCFKTQEEKKNAHTQFKNRLSTLEKHVISSIQSTSIKVSVCFFFLIRIIVFFFGYSAHEIHALYDRNRKKQKTITIFDTWFLAAFLR